MINWVLRLTRKLRGGTTEWCQGLRMFPTAIPYHTHCWSPDYKGTASGDHNCRKQSLKPDTGKLPKCREDVHQHRSFEIRAKWCEDECLQHYRTQDDQVKETTQLLFVPYNGIRIPLRDCGLQSSRDLTRAFPVSFVPSWKPRSPTIPLYKLQKQTAVIATATVQTVVWSTC